MRVRQMRLKEEDLINLELHFTEKVTNSRGYTETEGESEVIKFKASLHTKTNVNASRITGEPDTVLEAYTTDPQLKNKKYINSIIVNPLTEEKFVIEDLIPYTRHLVLSLKSKVG